jgi:AcrR family transcriptional regulator
MSSKASEEMNDTRDRILQTALDLFIEQGYETTSLREIAERVGVTKAALYYHFASKEEIFRTLMEPIFALQAQTMGMLQARPSREAWARGLATLVEWVLPQRRLFELFENNQSALHTMAHDSDTMEAHVAMHDRVNAVLSDEATPLADRVRMAGAVGFVLGVLGLAAGKAFWSVPPDELQPVLVEAINDVLRVDVVDPVSPGAKTT